MPPDIHLDPDGLRLAADSAATVLAALVALPQLPSCSVAPADGDGAAGVREEGDRLATALRRAREEVAELAAVLRVAACDAVVSDDQARRAVARVAGELR